MILILLGPPGAGKGTQAKLLSAEFHVPHISTGDMFRDHKARGTELGKQIQAIMDAGGLVTDDVTNALVKDRLSRPDVADGFILDGYPRTIAQAEYLDGLLQSMGRSLTRVVSYDVAEEAVVERISGRRSCPKCGAVYHVSANPPRRMGYCDRDGAGLVQRDDDKPENVKKRMAEYGNKTEPLKRFYRERGLLSNVDGIGTPEGILAATRAVLPK
ncbi:MULTISPECIES: adenylate kinase [unclassified Anaeromyxobacter]|uniref:adenylate kinase n=1 Tax=unclassified Anaeromyxobacter TaxID=2620896 RepID=UPI001F55BA48|nr:MULTISPECIES: adenylate kinase [unclassified Anaeromyxobacter]